MAARAPSTTSSTICADVVSFANPMSAGRNSGAAASSFARRFVSRVMTRFVPSG